MAVGWAGEGQGLWVLLSGMDCSCRDVAAGTLGWRQCAWGLDLICSSRRNDMVVEVAWSYC